MIKYFKFSSFVLGFCLTFFTNYIITLLSSEYNGYWHSYATDFYIKLMVFSGVEFIILLLILMFIIPKFTQKLEHKLLACFGASFCAAMLFYGSTRTSIVITALVFCLTYFVAINEQIKEKLHSKETRDKIKKLLKSFLVIAYLLPIFCWYYLVNDAICFKSKIIR